MRHQDEWSLKNVYPGMMGLTGNPVELVDEPHEDSIESEALKLHGSETTLPSVNFQSRPKNWPQVSPAHADVRH